MACSSPSGIFAGYDQATLNALKASALSWIQTGRWTNVSGGAKSGSRDFGDMSASDILREVRYAEQQNGTLPPRVSKVTQVLTCPPNYPFPNP